ncbi:MAG TPA: glycosyltransferase family A protein [Solirubrobacterales bacterium]|jgi:glycosyltransferase involved in cell wall biosynthesis|nr:glycosyltransferase family A protein [Solirubrobacterales bacterium]
MKPTVVTVAIPVLNGGEVLEEVLDAIAGQRNDSGVEVELLIVDSGSSDGSVELARRHGARLIEIDKSQFSHGGTRNRAVAEARGDVVAFLTQDATPANDRWLDSIVEGFAQSDDVALVFGPQIARPEHSHMVRREIQDHFSTWSHHNEILLQRIAPGPDGWAAYAASPGVTQFFSDVNGAVARWAWEQHPYREVPYAEDQLIGREIVEAGLAKVFHPAAAVVHSHDYPPLKFLKRYFDEYRGLREVLGHVEPAGPRHVARTVIGLTKQDRWFLRSEGLKGRELNRASLRSARHHLFRMIGSGLGSRADRLPNAVRAWLSLEGRSGFTALDLPAGLLQNPPANPIDADSGTGGR